MNILLIISILLIGSPVQGSDFATLNKQGVEAFKTGDFKIATDYFSEALKLSPDDTHVKNNFITASRSLAADCVKRNEWSTVISVLEKAYLINPENAEVRNDLVFAYVNYGATALHSKNISDAQQVASKALELDPDNLSVNCLAGDVAYAMHDLLSAEKYWLKAKGSGPNNKSISDRLSKLQNEKKTQGSYSKTQAYHFDIRFDYKTLGQGICDLREFLMEAYEKVGQDFDRFPQYPIVVILSSETDFRMVNKVPDFVAGLYDGKIRVPVNFSKVPMSSLKAIIFHEYTHALIFDIAGNSCPIWLNEGIAMLQMRTTDLVATDLLSNALKSGKVIPLEMLNDRSGIWNNPTYINLAYAQSWIIAEYLFTRWNYSQIKKVLVRLKSGDQFATIMKNDMNRTPVQFEQEWKAFALNKIQ
jgi:tetratricopeptide (TPR) repeat protein